MENIDKNFKYFDSQQDDEQVIMVVRRHKVSLFDTFAATALFYLLGFFAIFILPVLLPNIVEGYAYHVFVLVVSLSFVFTTTYLFSSWVMHYLTVCILTNEHFVDIVQGGLFSRKISSLSLDKIQDTSSFQAGFLNTLLNLGTVEVQTAGEAPNFVINNVPNPNKVSQKIMEVEEEFAKRAGLRHGDQRSQAPSQQAQETEGQVQSPIIELPENNSEQ